MAHDACDFISAVDTPAVWELNIWYHTLNCGFTTRISGETDFPCIYGERVGLGRSYVKLAGRASRSTSTPGWMGSATAAATAATGSRTCSTFEVNGLGVGEPGDGGRPSVLAVEGRAAGRCACKPRRCCRRNAARRHPQAAARTRSRTGTSSGPASATRGTCRSS